MYLVDLTLDGPKINTTLNANYELSMIRMRVDYSVVDLVLLSIGAALIEILCGHFIPSLHPPRHKPAFA